MLSAVAPLAPPKEWFFTPEPERLTPMHYGSDGRVYGHLAPWDTCHMGFLNGAFSECVKAPRSRSNYKFFNVGSIETAEGDFVEIGKLTYDTDHAPLTAGLQAASRHYDNTGSVGAFVRATDGRHGIWLAGSVRSDLAPEGVRDLRANGPSGDWRGFNGSLELIASLAVPVQGFPVPRPQLALSASAQGDSQIDALILPPLTELDTMMSREEYEEERDALVASLQPPPPQISRIEYLRERDALISSM
jgi:hypothetical protein